MLIDKNLKCPCGSGKLAKDCFFNPNYSSIKCKVFLKLFGTIFERNVNEFILSTVKEISETISVLENYSTAARSEMAILLIFSGTLSKIWDLFNYKESGNKNCLTNRFNKFLGTKNNKYREDNKELQKIDSELFCDLRNSLLHSFALPKMDESRRSVVLNKNAPESEIIKLKSLKESHNIESIIISPSDFFYLLRDGVNLMLNEMEDIKKDSYDYYNRIIKVGKTFYEEGAAIISEKDFENNSDLFNHFLKSGN